ncbi:formate dehydrogenase-O alpha subunit [Klebsiella pneumoniae]|uniref:Formate dehydrogenase-O alpha subunit n=1 Tax=Klebsiella pneumoniae TaxID=573 RepID=A0A378AZP0_KLEPN|nr:formate dehydrogenase-O alpha subunit [Klebsiella pneumoniae]
MKEDRDANFIAQNDAGTTVNRWLTTGMLCASPPVTKPAINAKIHPRPRDAGGG